MSASSVPPIQWTDDGLVLPAESAILSGVQSDIDAAFGGGLNPALETPQGQLASSEAAIIADKNAQIAQVVNNVDPQFSAGRWQDAIGRIYFLDRKPATSTAVSCTLTGLPGATIPGGSLAQDTDGNTYALTADAVISQAGTVQAEFQNILPGPIPCAAGSLVKVYQAVPGWDAITNAAPGTPGSYVESRADFEYRRKNSVAINGRGSIQSIYGAVFAVPNVVDVYAIDNTFGVVTLTGSISGDTLTASNVVGNLSIGSIIAGSGVSSNTFVTELLTGDGGAGTYRVNNSQSVPSVAMTSAGVVKGSTNYPLIPHSIYVAAIGGIDADIAKAIWSKKDDGCDYNGNTVEIVADDSGYSYPLPTYTVRFERPAALPIKFAVSIVSNPLLPSNIVALVKAAIIARFNGEDGTGRERIGALILASRYYGAVASAAPNVALLSILIGTSSATMTQVSVGIDQRPTLSESDISVLLV